MIPVPEGPPPRDFTIKNRSGVTVETRRVGYWGPPDPRGYPWSRPSTPEGTKDDWVILFDKPGAVGPFVETRTVTYTDWALDEAKTIEAQARAVELRRERVGRRR